GQISDESWSHYAKGMVRTKPQQEITAFLAENHISYIDLYPVFYAKQKQIPLYFKIDGHWNKEGHEIAAEEIFKYLKDNENKK
ncbi:MAG: hypothetical protein NT001_00180, partial [Candidatus Woesearchaeota archaeon]|nr:hypothetical protein [Candidatus Woesearchaeota archaeon]